MSPAAVVHVLHEGYGEERVASTTALIVDGNRNIITDPGMLPSRRALLDPLLAVGLDAGDITDVVFSHHHPDHTLNAALFDRARFHDHWAIYERDTWTWRDADGFDLGPNVRLLRTPGHAPEDITTVARTAGGVVAFTHLWNTGQSVGDRHAADLAALHLNRERVLAFADLVVPGHGPEFEPSPRTPR